MRGQKKEIITFLGAHNLQLAAIAVGSLRTQLVGTHALY